MTAKKVIGKLHLWLGLASGLVVFIVALTGCLYAFQAEIQDATQPYRFVEAQHKPILPPSVLRSIADRQLPGKQAHSVNYAEAGRSVTVIYYSLSDTYYYGVSINPYTGQVLNVTDYNQTFFRWVLNGHYYLWLPPAIGQPIVATATLVFVLLLLSGLVLWWPKNRKAANQRFSVKWSAKWRRVNYDLHNVFGFYVLIVGLVLGLTGLVWGFQWFAKAMYWSTSGGKALAMYAEPLSDTTRMGIQRTQPATDLLWSRLIRQQPDLKSVEVHFPETNTSSILISTNTLHDNTSRTDFRFYDQHTLAEQSVSHPYGRYEQASTADKIARLNYDIHTGRYGGYRVSC
nr:PepSY-associated TM helix domain-containing protein [Spirosoma rhododendri]